MLILSRKKDESIMINGNIEIVVVSVEDGKVKLGIKAPRDIEVHRKEIFEQIQEENRIAASSDVKVENLKQLFTLNKKNPK